MTLSAVCADVTKVKPVDHIHTEAFSGQCLKKKHIQVTRLSTNALY